MPREVDLEKLRHGTVLVKRGFARMQKGGVVMDVTNAEQAAVAEDAGAVAVMALERVPSDIRAQGGVARMSQTKVIEDIVEAVTVPVMAKCRIGHFVEAQMLQALGVDMIDESEVLTPADPFLHVEKHGFTVPFVCGARDLGEAVRRVAEGAAMIRTKGEAGTGNIVEAVRHRQMIRSGIASVVASEKDDLRQLAEQYALSYERLWKAVEEHGHRGPRPTIAFGKTHHELEAGILDVLLEIQRMKRLPVVEFAAGGIATPADAALMMQLGVDGVFVGSGIFKSEDPAGRARAIVQATTHFDDPAKLVEVSRDLKAAMPGIEIETIPESSRLQGRGW